MMPDVDVRRWLRSGSLFTLRGLSIVAFVVLLGLLIAMATAANPGVGAVVASFILFFVFRALLPAKRIDAFIQALMTGEAGERFYYWLAGKLATLRRWFPW